MKIAVTIYWLIGCALCGAVTSNHFQKCPHDETPVTVGDLVGVMIWPSFVVGAALLPRGFEFPPTKCKVQHTSALREKP